MLAVPFCHKEQSQLFSFVFTGRKSSQLVLDRHEGVYDNWTCFFYYFTVKVLIPSFSRYQVFSFCRSFSTLPSLDVWWGKQSIVLYLCSCLQSIEILYVFRCVFIPWPDVQWQRQTTSEWHYFGHWSHLGVHSWVYLWDKRHPNTRIRFIKLAYSITSLICRCALPEYGVRSWGHCTVNDTITLAHPPYKNTHNC